MIEYENNQIIGVDWPTYSSSLPREEYMKVKIITWIAFLILYIFMISIVVLMSRFFEYITPVGPWFRSIYTCLLIGAVTMGTVIGIKFFYTRRKK